MALSDDPALLRTPRDLAERVESGELELDDVRRRIGNLLGFARTFYGTVLAEEFDTQIESFDSVARRKGAQLLVRLRRRSPRPKPALALLGNFVDMCDLAMDLEDFSGQSDDEDRLPDVLQAIERLLDRFATWLDSDFALLKPEARRVSDAFGRASAKLLQ